MADDKLCSINVGLLPIKSHFFLFYGAMGGVMPFIPVLAKGLGIHATAVGLVYTILYFVTFFSKPIFGYLTDYFQNIKPILLTLVTVTTMAFMLVLLIPTLENLTWIEVVLECAIDKWWLYLKPQDFNKICLEDALKESMNCELNYLLCGSNSSVTFLGNFTIDETKNTTTSSFLNRYSPNSTVMFKFEPNSNFACDCVAENSSLFRCVSHDLNSCLKMDSNSVYKSFQFWLFTLLVVIAGTGALNVMSLSDAACYEYLGDNPEEYGQQRLWATISTSCFIFLAGLLNDIASESSHSNNYSSGFYLMLALLIIDLILLLKVKLPKANISTSICKDLGKIISSCETVAVATAAYVSGGLASLISNYLFWYLLDLGATQTLLGLTVAVRCLAAEVPFFYFTGWFIKKFGYFNCITVSFVAFTLRFGLYYVLNNPWLVFPIEMLHGVTFAVFYASMTGYASDNAPPGTEATMMGFLGGLYDGLGVATGSLLGGFGFDRLGGRSTFLIAGAISLVCAPTFALVHVVLKRRLPKLETTTVSEEKVNNDGASPTKT